MTCYFIGQVIRHIQMIIIIVKAAFNESKMERRINKKHTLPHMDTLDK